MSLEKMSNEQLLALAAQNGIQAKAPTAQTDLSKMSDDDLLQAAKAQGIIVQPKVSMPGDKADTSSLMDAYAPSPLKAVANFAKGVGNSFYDTGANLANLLPGVNVPLSKPVQETAKNKSAKIIVGDDAPLGTMAGFLPPTGDLREVDAPTVPNAYKTGKTLGDIASFYAGGEAAKAIPGVAKAGNLAKEALKGYNTLPALLASKAIDPLGRAAYAGAYGATMNPNDRAMGAIEGAGLSLGFDTLGGAAGLAFSRNNRQQLMLDYLKQQAAKGNALSPAKAAENQAMNYLDAAGKPVQADIGTIANNGTLKNTYQALRYSPFSGARQEMNQVANQLAAKDVKASQQQLAQSLAPAYQKELEAANNGLSGINEQINKTPDFFNSLANGVSNRAMMTQELKKAAQDAYQTEQAISRAKYAPINDSKLRLDNTKNTNSFPNYQSVAAELDAKRENFGNIFETDSDLGRSLNNELDKALSILDNNKKWGVTLPEAVSRMQNLGRLAAAAKGQGKRYEGMLLDNLGQALKTDIDTGLRKTGNEGIANALQDATAHYRDNVVPFWQNPVIRKAATEKDYIPPKAQLATALHDANNRTVLGKLPDDYKNASLYQLMTSGKGTSQGLSNMTAEDIASTYKRLPVDAKAAIAQYNPTADKLFESLPQTLEQRKVAQDKIAELSKKAEKQSKQIEKAKTVLADAKKAEFGVTQGGSSTLEKLAKGGAFLGAAATAKLSLPLALTVGAPLAFGRSLRKDLSDPNLIKAYTSGKAIDAISPKGRFNKLGSKVYPLTAKAVLANLLAGNQ